jgi:hypothetical protein
VKRAHDLDHASAAETFKRFCIVMFAAQLGDIVGGCENPRNFGAERLSDEYG